jgi:hypothetical protein
MPKSASIAGLHVFIRWDEARGLRREIKVNPRCSLLPRSPVVERRALPSAAIPSDLRAFDAAPDALM